MGSSSLELPGVALHDLKAIRQFVWDQLAELEMDSDVIYDLLLVVTEAVTNVIEHGYKGNSGWVKVKIKPQGKDISLSIIDHAPAFDPTEVDVPDLTASLEQRILGGMGIHLIRQNVDRLNYRAVLGGGNELIVVRENVIPGV